MLLHSTKLAMLTSVLCVLVLGAARADREDDMAKLDQAMKTQTLAAEAKAILKDARKKAVEAVKKDDDATCNKLITEAMSRAGVKM
jgi:hypothetical protein